MSKALSASLEVPSSPGTYTAALEGLTRVNEVLMGRDPVPPLYSTGARWEVRQGDPSETKWRYAPDVAGEGWGDCQDLSAYRAAELRVTGQDPAAHVRVYPTGPNRYHAVVARGNGMVEDPSVILGMDPIPESPHMTTQLPIVAGPGMDAVRAGLQAALKALHPNAQGGVLGSETGQAPKLARVRDVAPDVAGPTFHVVPHICGPGDRKWKGVHRVPLRDGSAIVGMTASHAHPCDVIGDGTGLLSSIGHAILNHPILSALVSPEAYLATKALMEPSTQYALKSTEEAARGAASGSKDPDSIWGAAVPNRGGGFTGPGGGGRPAGQAPMNFARALAGMRGGGVPASGQPGAAGAPGMVAAPLPPGTINPATGQPYPPGTTSAMAAQMASMYPTTLPPGTINPATGAPYPPGTTPQMAAMMAQVAQMSQGQGGFSGGGGGFGGGGPTAADLGITPDSGTGFSDPNAGFGGLSDQDSAALSSYYDPTASLGYWNT